jgi:hypothetical protein
MARIAVAKFLVAAFVSVVTALVSAAEDPWEIELDEPGLQVQTRVVEGSRFRAFRATARITATPDQVLARLYDVASYPNWFPDTLEARQLTTAGGAWANYVRTDVPWPAKDRDAVYTNSMHRDETHIRIDIGVDPAALPDVDDAVRVLKAGGFWDLTAVPSSQEVTDGDVALLETILIWEFHLEPGGNVPSAIANQQIAKTPKGALRALRAYFAEARSKASRD